jgi:hypothetical protein
MDNRYEQPDFSTILKLYEKYCPQNTVELQNFYDAPHGQFLEFGPAIKLNIPHDVCCDLIADTNWGELPLNEDDHHRKLSHEVAHYFQLLGTSYGYLLYRARRARHINFYHLFRRKAELYPDEKLQRPCKNFFMKTLGAGGADSLFSTLAYDYFYWDLMISFLHDYKGRDSEYYTHSMVGLCTKILGEDVHNTNTIMDESVLGDCLALTDKAMRRWMVSLSKDDSIYPNFTLSPRAIIEGYARVVEHISLRNKNVELLLSDQQQFKKMSQTVYGDASNYLWEELGNIIHQRQLYPFMMLIFIAIFELSLMVRLHPALMKGIYLKNFKIEEFFVLDRFFSIVNVVKKELLDKERLVVSQLIEVSFDNSKFPILLDYICAQLGWLSYSKSLEELSIYYDRASENIKHKDARYFYDVTKKIINIKREYKGLPLLDSRDLLAFDVDLIILCPDGKHLMGKPSSDSDLLDEILSALVVDMNNLEIMEVDNFKVTEEYRRYIYPPIVSVSFLLSQHPFERHFS